jgi:nucleolar MIF4G domain-containing protein 1
MKTALGTKSSGDCCLRVTLSDLLNADTRGRWWKAGASWAGNQSGGESVDEGSGKVKETSIVGNLREDEEQKLLKIAARMKLNTSTRKSIFLVIMSSRDVNDAFERLARMELKGKQDRDIVRVISECCGREKSYNAFYSELANLLCSHNRQFKTTLQFSFWDTFKTFGDEELSDRRAVNLARMMAHLVCSFQLPLSIIKPIDMSQQLSESATLFLATFFMAIFASDVAEDSFQSIFDRVATTKDFAAVRDAVILFLRQYYTGAPKSIEADKAVLMDRRRKLALATMEKMTVLDYRGSEDD